MWIEWPDGLINLDHAQNIHFFASGFEQWEVEIILKGGLDYYARYFESEKNAREEYERLKEMLLSSSTILPNSCIPC